MQIAGGIAYVEEYPYERFLRDARINMIFEGTNEILRHFIAMNGLKAPGAALAEASRSGAPAEGALRRIAESQVGATSGLAFVHAAFAEEARRAERLTAELGACVQRALVEHGRAIAERELVQERLSDAAMDLYVACACLSRIHSAIEAGAPEGGDESRVARKAICDALARVEGSVRTVDAGDDDLVRAVGTLAARTPAWPFGLVP